VPFINIAPIVAGTNGISPIFLTTVDVTGGIGLDLQNWVKLLTKMEMQFVMKMVM
jgi:aconitate hydratase 2/2-methylisocitrate dehydratase